MKTFLKNFFVEEQGQDLIEYSLLMAFVALASAAIFTNTAASLSGIWVTANSVASKANSAAAGTPS